MADASTPPHAFFDSDAASECESSVAGTPTPYARRGRCILADAASEAHFGVGARFWDSDGASDAESEATPYAERALRDLRDRRPRPTPRLVRPRASPPASFHVTAAPAAEIVGAVRVVALTPDDDEPRPVRIEEGAPSGRAREPGCVSCAVGEGLFAWLTTVVLCVFSSRGWDDAAADPDAAEPRKPSARRAAPVTLKATGVLFPEATRGAAEVPPQRADAGRQRASPAAPKTGAKPTRARPALAPRDLNVACP